jgi:N-acetyl sugar amidotransferase
MDASAGAISFDENGFCNYCASFLAGGHKLLGVDSETLKRKRDAFVAEVKAAGKGKRYDCIVGVSGGVDSSWALVQAVKLGLRPLAVHMDNGWNSELAQNNIANLVRTLGVDLHTHVIDWEEYRELMQAFFDADVIDVELLYDNAMIGVNLYSAARFGLRHILSGSNLSTEGIPIPEAWAWLKNDARNIRGIGARRGVKLKTFPAIGTFGYVWYRLVRRVQWVHFLDYVDYRKQDALDVLQRDFGYKPYPYKHYESVFTRFYQGYILPEKFGVDKRRVHLSSLVMTGQMKRDEALAMLAGLPYPSAADLESDKEYFVKKMGWSRSDLDAYIRRPAKAHTDYPSEKKLWDFFFGMHRRFRRAH